MSDTLTPPVPIVLVGIHTEIGAPVAEGLKPDWEVIRFIQSISAASSDLPHLLSGHAPPTPATNTIGSESYTSGRGVRAIIFGRGFTSSDAKFLHDSIPSTNVAWIAADDAKRPLSQQQNGNTEPPPGVEKIMVPLFRGALEKWRDEGGEGGLFLY